MPIQKYRWSRDYESAEEELIQQLKTKHIATERWAATEYQQIDEQNPTSERQLWCVEGSIVYKFADRSISLQAGDALRIPAGTIHSAQAGISGCVCYEQVSPQA